MAVRRATVGCHCDHGGNMTTEDELAMSSADEERTRVAVNQLVLTLSQIAAVVYEQFAEEYGLSPKKFRLCFGVANHSDRDGMTELTECFIQAYAKWRSER